LLQKNLLQGMAVNQAIRFFIFQFFRSVSAPENVCSFPLDPRSQLVDQPSVTVKVAYVSAVSSKVGHPLLMPRPFKLVNR